MPQLTDWEKEMAAKAINQVLGDANKPEPYPENWRSSDSHVVELEAQVAALTADIAGINTYCRNLEHGAEAQIHVLTAQLSELQAQRDEKARWVTELQHNQEALISTNNDHVARLGALTAERDNARADYYAVCASRSKLQEEIRRLNIYIDTYAKANGAVLGGFIEKCERLEMERDNLKRLLETMTEDRDAESRRAERFIEQSKARTAERDAARYALCRVYQTMELPDGKHIADRDWDLIGALIESGIYEAALMDGKEPAHD